MIKQRVQNASTGYQAQYFSKRAAAQHWVGLLRDTVGETILKGSQDILRQSQGWPDPGLLKVLLWDFQRPPPINISMHLQSQQGCLIYLPCPVTHFPLKWKSQSPLGFYFSYIWATMRSILPFWDDSGKMFCNSKLCVKKHSGTSPKMHLKKCAEANNWEKKPTQATNRMHWTVLLKYAKENLLKAKAYGFERASWFSIIH